MLVKLSPTNRMLMKGYNLPLRSLAAVAVFTACFGSVFKLDRQSEKYIREMIWRNRLYGSPLELLNKAIFSFYKQEKERGLKLTLLFFSVLVGAYSNICAFMIRS